MARPSPIVSPTTVIARLSRTTRRSNEHRGIGCEIKREEDREYRRHRRHEPLRRPCRRQQPKSAAGERQHQALYEQLVHDPQPCAADGQTDRDLLLTRRSERQHHVRQIHARRQQHRRCKSLQDPPGGIQYCVSSCGLVLMSRRSSVPTTSSLVLVVVGIGLFVRRRQ